MDNRAVLALFRIFGGFPADRSMEAGRMSEHRGMHRAELYFLAWWVPLTVMVALGEVLFRNLGVLAASLLLLPLGFISINLLTLALGAKTPQAQWRMWLIAGTLWAWFHRHASAPAVWVAWSWLAIFILNAMALISLCCGKLIPGRTGGVVTQRIALLLLLHLAALLAGWHWGWWWAVAGGAMIAALFCHVVLRPSCPWLGPVRRHTGTRDILITIDDGPDPHDTPRALDLLDRHQVKAVFFMIGEKVEKHPELAREVLRRGHEIGNHTMTHPQGSFWCAGPWRTRREIARCQEVIERVTGAKPRWFRAPVGHRNWFTHPIARDLGLEVMGWSRRGFDAVETDVPRILRRILGELSPGDIVLVHEATPVAGEVLEGVIKGAAAARIDRCTDR